MTSPDFADDQPHIAHANAIAVTGVPLLSLATSLLNITTQQSVGPASGLILTVPALSLNQIGYEVSVGVQANAASAFPLTRFVLTWSDSVSGNTVAQDTWVLAGGSGVPQTYVGTGPTKGDTVTIEVFNDDPTNAMLVTMSMVENSRVYVRDDWRNLSTQTVPGATKTNYSLGAGILGNPITATNAGLTAARYLGLYAGLVSITFSGSQPYQLQIQHSNGEISLLAPTIVYEAIVAPAGGGLIQATAGLPRGFCQLVWTNNGGAAGSFTGTVTIGEQQP
jgi:hypothetical protein